MSPADGKIWDYAKKNNFIIVTFDEDLANLYGFPPKVIVLRLGNSSTQAVADAILSNMSDIKLFYTSETYGLLEIF